MCRRGKDAIVSRMEARLADWTHLGVAHQEDTQILRCKSMDTIMSVCDVPPLGFRKATQVSELCASDAHHACAFTARLH